MSTLKHYSDSAMSAAGNFKIWDFGKDRYGNDFSPEYHDIWVIEEDGSMYKGFWKDGMKQGRGVQILTNKDYYDGDFNYDTRTGFGTSILPNGD